MTNEEILKLAETYFEESFVEYDEDDNEVADFVASKENLLKFALAIHEDGYNKGYDDGWESSKESTEMNTWSSDDD